MYMYIYLFMCTHLSLWYCGVTKSSLLFCCKEPPLGIEPRTFSLQD